MTSLKPLPVTEPCIPALDDFRDCLADVWARKWLTNNGQCHRELEAALAGHLGVDYVSLFCNGTIALQVGLQVLGAAGKVVTTPFSFPATTHAIRTCGCTPVFCDVDPETGTLDASALESAITPDTTLVLPVHVYGTPCNVQAIREIADRHDLKVFYDAAHAFGVTLNGNSILNHGDLSMLSFHATKVYNTMEGGALVTSDPEVKQRIDCLKDFGFVSETEVVEAGTNGKMNEVQAAYGLLQLKTVAEQIARRLERTEQYRQALAGTPGLRVPEDPHGVQPNGSYFPVFIDAEQFGMTRDEVYEGLKKRNIFGRRYFYPLISEFPMYRDCRGASPRNLHNARRLSREVLCLPLFADITEADVDRVVNAIQTAKG